MTQTHKAIQPIIPASLALQYVSANDETRLCFLQLEANSWELEGRAFPFHKVAELVPTLGRSFEK